jgi:hypothetical protein
VTNPGRIGAIDFWRGVILFAILIDHIPGNLIEFLTPRNFGISDSAEAFVFLSGLSVGFTYLRKAEKQGMGAVARGAAARAGRIYAIHLALTLGGFAIFWLGYSLFDLPDLIEAHGRDLLFHQPGRGVIGVVLLSHQLGYFNILPLYVVLMLATPGLLLLTRASRVTAVAISIGFYLAASRLGLGLPNWPQPGGWFFNPFAWQLIFTLGIVAASVFRETPPRRSLALYWAAWTIVALGAAIMTNAIGLAPGLYAKAFAFFDVGKQNLGSARIVYFLSLAYAIAMTPRLMALAGPVAGEHLRRVGRHSLQIFAAGSLLSALGQAILAASSAHISDPAAHMFGLIYTIAGLGALIWLARFLEEGVARDRSAAKAPAPGLLAPSIR